MKLTQLGQMWGRVFLKGPILSLLFVNDMPRVVENASLAMQSTVNTLFLGQGIQRTASRFMVGKGSELSYRDRLIKLRLLPLNYCWNIWIWFSFINA